MSRKFFISATASAIFTLSAAQFSVAAELDTLSDRVSYILGYNIGQNFKNDQIDIDADIFRQAMLDAQKGKMPELTQEEMQMAMKSFQDQQQAKRNEAMKVVADANQKEGDAFLKANGAKEGVVTTSSGLQYKVLTKGSGPKPTAGSQVSVHYRGTLLDGSEFDSSYRRGQPAVFGVTQVIPGWTEVLQLMPEGSKWEVYIPSDLAYGAGGAGGNIGPNATLVFEIELLSANAQ